jgi:hypothetical protein
MRRLWFHIGGRTFRFVRGTCESIQIERGMRMAVARAGFFNAEFRTHSW